eukprot:993656-Amphidinium_carterae.1
MGQAIQLPAVLLQSTGWATKLVSKQQRGRSQSKRRWAMQRKRGQATNNDAQVQCEDAPSKAAETETVEGTTKEELLSKLQKLEMAQKLRQASGAASAHEDVAERIANTRVALKEVEPTAKRL